MTPDQPNVDRELETSMKMFERVQVGEVSPIEPRRPERVLLALDGSSQDPMSLAVASALRLRFNCQIAVLAACENSAAVTRNAVEQLGAGTTATTGGTTEAENEPFDDILAAAETERANLVVAPCPFGRDFEKVGPDSAGTVIDVLLARLQTALLVVRQPHEIQTPAFHRVAMRLAGENKAALDAARWAAGMVAPGGNLELVLELEEETREHLSSLLESLHLDVEPTEDALAAALQKTHVRLHRALQKAAEKTGFDYSLTVKTSPDPESLGDKSFEDLSLAVVALERPDHSSHGYSRDCILHAHQPVLVVPED